MPVKPTLSNSLVIIKDGGKGSGAQVMCSRVMEYTEKSYATYPRVCGPGSGKRGKMPLGTAHRNLETCNIRRK